MMNPKNIVRLLQENFNDPMYDYESVTTDDEKKFAMQLDSLIKDAVHAELFVETSSTLCFEDGSIKTDIYTIDEEFESDFEEIKTDKEKKVKAEIDFAYKKKAVEYWKNTGKDKLKFTTVKNQFRFLKDVKMLHRWEAQVEKGGSRIEKVGKICKYVMNEFEKARDMSLPIHDIDIKRWALKARDEVNLSKELFTASSKWIHHFKKKHRIVSRKINKFVTQTQLKNKDELKQSSDEFVQKIRRQISLHGADNVYNSDQSGFNLETHGDRTLSFKGDEKIECIAQSLNSLTHSYTIQPIVTASGLLKSPLFIVLQEKGGKFGPLVEKNLYKADNIAVLCSASGKLTSDLAAQWYKDVYVPNADKHSVLCLDSWTGQTKKNFDKVNTKGKDVEIFTIPAGTTGMIQPLDVYGFRPWKNFVKHFSDAVILYGYEVNLHLRNNVLKVQSLTHNQFSSPRFVNLFKYSWFKSGYIDEEPPKCETPVKYCFQNDNGTCHCCDDSSFFRCAWCANFMCFEHFFDPKSVSAPHFCYNYQL